MTALTENHQVILMRAKFTRFSAMFAGSESFHRGSFYLIGDRVVSAAIRDFQSPELARYFDYPDFQPQGFSFQNER
jgi:hypothetical protein